MTILKNGEKFDRVGSETGKCVGKVGSYVNSARFEERLIPYRFSEKEIEKEPSYSEKTKESMKSELSRYYEKHNERYAPKLNPKEMDGLKARELQECGEG